MINLAKIKQRLQWVFAFVLLPAVNLMACFYTNIFYQNQTYIGNELGHSLYLFLWGSSNACYFFVMSRKCMHRYPCLNQGYEKLLAVLCIMMALSVLIPYYPQTLFQLSKWHVRLAMISSAGFAILFFYFLFMGTMHGYGQFQHYLFYYMLICMVSLCGFASTGGVTSFTEITFSVGMGFLLYHMVSNKPGNRK